MSLSGRELDIAIEYNLFHAQYMKNKGHWARCIFGNWNTPHYTTDVNALWDMEAEIERQYLGDTYVMRLTEIVFSAQYESYRQRGILPEFYDTGPTDVLALKTAPPESCCRAALLAVMEALK